MIALNLQTSFLTPPFGFALFYLRGVAPESVPTSAIYRGVIPFIILQLLLMVALWFWPAMATWLPGVLD
jgi:TRAP-type mannitol/chloroaromatic compound transport system permease large subunit